MPNWCENRLTITGDKKQIAKFKKQAKAKDTDLSLNKLVPLPKELNGTSAPMPEDTEVAKKTSQRLIKKYGFDNWYAWCVANWGTKWDIEATLESDDDEYLEYSFGSAWSPPVEWLEKVAKMYPKLSFRLKYEEEGVGFMGVATGEKGMVNDRCLEY